jgi:ABC-type Fe3+ transport system permease subunit/sugar lactone lactonase YvrE
MNLNLLINSLVLVTGTTALALVCAIPVALAAQMAGARGRRWIGGACLLTLALPAFFVSGMWMEWIGFSGAWRVSSGWLTERWMPIAVSSVVLALLLWPIGALLLIGAWDRLDVRVLEAEPELRGRALLTEVLWPLVRPALVQPALVIAVLALGHFSVPALFQARVWPAEVWVEYSTRFDAWAAWQRCWPLGILAVAAVMVLTRQRWTWPILQQGACNRLVRDRLGRAWVVGTSAVAIGVVLLALVFPVMTALAAPRTWTELVPALRAAGGAAFRTLAYSAVAATAVMVLAVAFVRWRALALSALTFVVPGVFTGMVLAEASGNVAWDPFRSAGGWVVVALGVRYFFVAWLVSRRRWVDSDSRLREWAGLAGAGRWAMWRHAVVQGSWGPIAGAWFVVYLLGLWDVETSMLVVPPGGDTLGLMIFNLLHYGHNAQVTALCLLLGAVAVTPWLAWTFSRRLLPVILLMGLGWGGSGCSPGDGGTDGTTLKSALFERVEVIGGKGTGPGRFSKPRSVAVDADGKLYVVDMTGRVQRFGVDGRWEMLWQMPETTIGRPKGMDAVAGGGVWLVEPHYHRVNRFSPDGTLTAQWGSHGLEPGQLWFPRAIAVATDGTCFVSEYGKRERIQRFRSDTGEYMGSFGGEGTEPGRLNRAEGLGIGPAGEVYVADSCNHRIQVFAADGRLLRAYGKAGQEPGEFSYPYDVRVDAEGRQYVCEFGNSRVQVLGPDDRPLEVLGGPGALPNEMNNPWSLCLDGAGNLYVADSLNHRVVKYVRRGGKA